MRGNSCGVKGLFNKRTLKANCNKTTFNDTQTLFLTNVELLAASITIYSAFDFTIANALQELNDNVKILITQDDFQNQQQNLNDEKLIKELKQTRNSIVNWNVTNTDNEQEFGQTIEVKLSNSLFETSTPGRLHDYRNQKNR